jgi:hypothetical protein
MLLVKLFKARQPVGALGDQAMLQKNSWALAPNGRQGKTNAN